MNYHLIRILTIGATFLTLVYFITIAFPFTSKTLPFSQIHKTTISSDCKSCDQNLNTLELKLQNQIQILKRKAIQLATQLYDLKSQQVLKCENQLVSETLMKQKQLKVLNYEKEMFEWDVKKVNDELMECSRAYKQYVAKAREVIAK